MIITLMKNGETVKPNDKEASHLTRSGVATVMGNSLILLNLCGKRPLYSATSKGDYILKAPETQDSLAIPELILTGSDINSYKTGKILNETIKDLGLERVEIKAGKSSNSPKDFIAQHPEIKHIVIIGSDFCLKKWEKAVLPEGYRAKGAESSSMLVVKDNQVIFDSENQSELYMVDGIMDEMLIRKLNNTAPDSLPTGLKPFAQKLKGMMPAERMIYKIDQKTL